MPKSNKPELPYDAWTHALRAVEVQMGLNTPGAMTVGDLSELWACSRETARLRVKRLLAAKKARPAIKVIVDTMGRRHRWPAYMLWTNPGSARAGKTGRWRK